MATPSRTKLLAWIGIGFVLVVSAGIWIYALYIADVKPQDTLDDPSFGKSAQQVCSASVKELGDAGVVDKVASSMAERADLASAADAVLAKMVDRLEQILPASGEDNRILTLWVGDWRKWLEDRATWEAQLRAGHDGPFNERQRDTGEPNSQQLDKLANTNGMPACAIPQGI